MRKLNTSPVKKCKRKLYTCRNNLHNFLTKSYSFKSQNRICNRGKGHIELCKDLAQEVGHFSVGAVVFIQEP